ncbi:glycosyltransferase [Halobacillus yeomjeoni]|uniref:Glycosyltransferase n=1 Tax=Halobacillus yeomjeoni TaxID=311194 RepID=A0A931HWG6_9BACI|nr:glycosyltransferase [Halobacillus yeomjeoni]MBH0230748.1 hypothetical protein [Halobacillus yeomjeoni]
MSKILFITSRNIINTSGELRLIKNRTQVLNEKYGITKDFAVICNKHKLKSKRELIGNNSTIYAQGFLKYNPFSFIFQLVKFNKRIKKFINENSYEAIIISGALAVFCSKLVYRKKNNKSKMILDVHGALEELVEFKTKNRFSNIVKQIVYNFLKYLERKNLKYFDSMFVVSKALEDYMIQEYNLENYKAYRIPCSIEMSSIDLSTNYINRKKYREKYGINDELLFIYSGGISSWQCIEETVSLFLEIQKRLTKKKCKLLILSFEAEKLRHLKSDKSIILDSVSADIVKDVLCAGDFAFLLRKDYITNNVAFPNKFLEYISSGMKLITTPYIFDVANMVKSNNLGTTITNIKECHPELIDYIEQGYKYGEDFDKRKGLLASLSFEKRLKPFVKDIQ